MVRRRAITNFAFSACLELARLLHTNSNDEVTRRRPRGGLRRYTADAAEWRARLLALYDLNKSPTTRHTEKMSIKYYPYFLYFGQVILAIGNLDAYELKVNKDIFKYQEKVISKTNLSIPEIFLQWLIRVCFIPIK